MYIQEFYRLEKAIMVRVRCSVSIVLLGCSVSCKYASVTYDLVTNTCKAHTIVRRVHTCIELYQVAK